MYDESPNEHLQNITSILRRIAEVMEKEYELRLREIERREKMETARRDPGF